MTEPEPFSLKTGQRGDKYKEEFKIRVDEEVKSMKKQAQFRAKPFVQKNVFEPQKSTRPLTELTDVVLNSDRRALKRKEFEDTLKEKESMYEDMKKKWEAEQKVCFFLQFESVGW